MSAASPVLYKLMQHNAVDEFMLVIKSSMQDPSFSPIITYSPTDDTLVLDNSMAIFAQCLQALEKLYGDPRNGVPCHSSLYNSLDFMVHTVVRWIITIFGQIYEIPINDDMEHLCCHLYKHLYCILCIPETVSIFNRSPFVEESADILARAFGRYGQLRSYCYSGFIIGILSSEKIPSSHLRAALHTHSREIYSEPLYALRAASDLDNNVNDDIVNRYLVQLGTLCLADHEFQEILRQQLAPKTLVAVFRRYIEGPPTHCLGNCLLAISLSANTTRPMLQALDAGLMETLATFVLRWGQSEDSYLANQLESLLEGLCYSALSHREVLMKVFGAMEIVAQDNLDGLGVGRLRITDGASRILQHWLSFSKNVREAGRLDPDTRELTVRCVGPSCAHPCSSTRQAKRCSVCSVVVSWLEEVRKNIV